MVTWLMYSMVLNKIILKYKVSSYDYEMNVNSAIITMKLVTLHMIQDLQTCTVVFNEITSR